MTGSGSSPARTRCASWRRSASRSRTRRHWPTSTPRTHGWHRSRTHRSTASFVPTAPNWVKVENARVLQHDALVDLHRPSQRQGGCRQGKRSDHPDLERSHVVRPGSGRRNRLPGPRGRRRRRAVSAPAAAASPRQAASFRSLSPYVLLAPAALVDRRRARVSGLLPRPAVVQQSASPSSITKKGTWIGVDNFTRGSSTTEQFWTVVLRTVVFTAVNVGLTMVFGTLIALLLDAARPVHASAAHDRARARVGDARSSSP